jgi:hypothetical protein
VTGIAIPGQATRKSAEIVNLVFETISRSADPILEFSGALHLNPSHVLDEKIRKCVPEIREKIPRTASTGMAGLSRGRGQFARLELSGIEM